MLTIASKIIIVPILNKPKQDWHCDLFKAILHHDDLILLAVALCFKAHYSLVVFFLGDALTLIFFIQLAKGQKLYVESCVA